MDVDKARSDIATAIGMIEDTPGTATAIAVGLLNNVLCELGKPAEQPLVPPSGLTALLNRFYLVWNRCESTRGCYSCNDPHDSRCPKDRGIGECECGRRHRVEVRHVSVGANRRDYRRRDA